MARLFGIAGVQMKVIPWNPSETVQKMAQIINRIGRSFPWVNMIVFHELVIPGLVQFDALPDLATWAHIPETIPGPSTKHLCELAHREKKWIIPGSMYERDGEQLFNTAIAISPAGEIVAKYRKIFPWLPLEAETSAGSEFVVFDVPKVGRFGLSICYDMWFPEMIRTLAWMGAEVILHPTMTPTSDRDLELVLSQANAIMNQCYFIDINGIGPWGGGYSLMIDPDGRILQKAGTNERIMTEILDLDRVTMAREYGNLGLAQTLKQLRDSKVKFPPYQNDFASGEVFKSMGLLELPYQLNPANFQDETE